MDEQSKRAEWAGREEEFIRRNRGDIGFDQCALRWRGFRFGSVKLWSLLVRGQIMLRKSLQEFLAGISPGEPTDGTGSAKSELNNALMEQKRKGHCKSMGKERIYPQHPRRSRLLLVVALEAFSVRILRITLVENIFALWWTGCHTDGKLSTARGSVKCADLVCHGMSPSRWECCLAFSR